MRKRMFGVSMAAVLLVLGVVAMAADAPEATSPAAEDAPAVAPGEPIEIEVPAPVAAQLTKSEAVQLETSAVSTAEAVANNEVSLVVATRDPTRSIDFGAGWELAALAGLFTMIVSPLATEGMKKIKWIGTANAATWNLALAVVFNLVVGWKMFAPYYTNLPQDPIAWIFIGLMGGGAGSAGKSWMAKRNAKSGG